MVERKTESSAEYKLLFVRTLCPIYIFNVFIHIKHKPTYFISSLIIMLLLVTVDKQKHRTYLSINSVQGEKRKFFFKSLLICTHFVTMVLQKLNISIFLPRAFNSRKADLGLSCMPPRRHQQEHQIFILN